MCDRMIWVTIISCCCLFAGCATNPMELPDQNYFQSLALNSAAKRQIKETGVFVKNGETLVRFKEARGIEKSIQDWRNSQHHKQLFAILFQQDSHWVLKGVSEKQPEYARNDNQYRIVRINSNKPEPKIVSHFAMK